MKRSLSLSFIILIIVIISCNQGPGKDDILAGYNFKSPDLLVRLPDDLHEISGITIIDSTSFACIQDEKGILFIYDFKNKKITKEVKFFSRGDYEGIARVEDSMYVLRSDGDLFEICNYLSDRVIVIPYPTYVHVKDNEGLCYDKDNNMLLITGKQNTDKGEGLKNRRFIYGFDLTTKSLIKEPIYTFNIKSIKESAVNNNVELPTKDKKKKNKLFEEPVLLFRPSAICIHPVTGKIFFLCSEDHMLFIIDKSGNIDQMIKLDRALFNQPEGITFLSNGDMLISNEGPDKGPATLLRFNYHP